MDFVLVRRPLTGSLANLIDNFGFYGFCISIAKIVERPNEKINRLETHPLVPIVSCFWRSFPSGTQARSHRLAGYADVDWLARV